MRKIEVPEDVAQEMLIRLLPLRECIKTINRDLINRLIRKGILAEFDDIINELTDFMENNKEKTV